MLFKFMKRGLSLCSEDKGLSPDFVTDLLSYPEQFYTLLIFIYCFQYERML